MSKSDAINLNNSEIHAKEACDLFSPDFDETGIMEALADILPATIWKWFGNGRNALNRNRELAKM